MKTTPTERIESAEGWTVHSLCSVTCLCSEDSDFGALIECALCPEPATVWDVEYLCAKCDAECRAEDERSVA